MRFLRRNNSFHHHSNFNSSNTNHKVTHGDFLIVNKHTHKIYLFLNTTKQWGVPKFEIYFFFAIEQLKSIFTSYHGFLVQPSPELCRSFSSWRFPVEAHFLSLLVDLYKKFYLQLNRKATLFYSYAKILIKQWSSLMDWILLYNWNQEWDEVLAALPGAPPVRPSTPSTSPGTRPPCWKTNILHFSKGSSINDDDFTMTNKIDPKYVTSFLKGIGF